MYRYNYDYKASVEEFLNFKWTLVTLNNKPLKRFNQTEYILLRK